MPPQTLPERDTQPQTTEELPYKVIIHNDNITPMDFVVRILLQVFLLSAPGAIQVMYTAHYHGSAYVQTLPKTEAQNRIARAHFASALEGFPLHFSMEPDD